MNNHQQLTNLLHQYQTQMQQLKQIGTDSPEGQQLAQEVAQIRQVLAQYQQRIQQANAAAHGGAAPVGGAGATGSSGGGSQFQGQIPAGQRNVQQMQPRSQLSIDDIRRMYQELSQKADGIQRMLRERTNISDEERQTFKQEEQRLRSRCEHLRTTEMSLMQRQQQQQQNQQQGQQQQQQPQVQQGGRITTPTSAGMMAGPGTPGSGATRGTSPMTPTGPSARPNPPNHAAAAQAMSQQQHQRPSVPAMQIPQTLNVKSPMAVTMKQGRPTLTGGGAMGTTVLTTPAMHKAPAFEVQGGDRVLTKRKLSELVASVVGDERGLAGASANAPTTTIDGDVEEILLDLADEFVTSVTSFACRLAKHRGSDTLEARDIQMHLEQNWNIRVPGYASDEIRSVRRIAPTASYTQKLSGVNMSRAVGR